MIEKADEGGAAVEFLNEENWRKVATGGKYLKKASLPENALKARKLVYVCCMKSLANIWNSFKLATKHANLIFRLASFQLNDELL